MRRAVAADDVPGQDSFLDVVANIVGILIILVMVVGVRAGQARRATLADQTAGLAQQVAQRQARAGSLQADTRALDQQAHQIAEEIAARGHERQQWETFILVGQKELEDRRCALDGAARAGFDLQQQLESARDELDWTTREQISLEAEKAAPVTIENRPAPLSRTVLGRESHYQLRGGRITHIPLDALLLRFRSAAQRQMWKLADRTEMTDSVGPVGGFRLRYRLERFDIPRRVQLQTGQSGSLVRLARWELLPVSYHSGEQVAAALADGSQFRRTLADARPGTATLTIWTYPDSFGALRELQEQLHTLGHRVAVRPLPDGMPISGSPAGSRSAAQ